jgi:hypothetical protein
MQKLVIAALALATLAGCGTANGVVPGAVQQQRTTVKAKDLGNGIPAHIQERLAKGEVTLLYGATLIGTVKAVKSAGQNAVRATIVGAGNETDIRGEAQIVMHFNKNFDELTAKDIKPGVKVGGFVHYPLIEVKTGKLLPDMGPNTMTQVKIVK